MRITYFVHDLGDPAVHRRVRMLQAAGARVTLLGFCRTRTISSDVPYRILGRTADGRFVQRVLAVLGSALGFRRWCREARGADLIVARQLEMLALGWLARRGEAREARLIYECLDIHRLMLGRGIVARMLRAAERGLLRASDGLVVSSEAYVREYFMPAHRALPPLAYIENKVLRSELPEEDLAAAKAAPAVPGPPWRIGWYGAIRCRRSLVVLTNLARALPGLVEIHVRGSVTADTAADLQAIVESTPGLTYGGPYDRRRDLRDLYASVHFFWAIDFFDGQASAWLLPNRLYEGGLFGCVPIALRDREVGRWLARRGAGLLLGPAFERELEETLVALRPETYESARTALRNVPAQEFLYDAADCDALASHLLFAA